MTDEELYRSYLDGDETGLAALMDQYGNALTLYIDGYLGDIHEAEDLMIEVFSYLLVKRPHIRDGGLKAYLYKACCIQSGKSGRRAGSPDAGRRSHKKQGAKPHPAPLHGAPERGIPGSPVPDLL